MSKTRTKIIKAAWLYNDEDITSEDAYRYYFDHDNCDARYDSAIDIDGNIDQLDLEKALTYANILAVIKDIVEENIKSKSDLNNPSQYLIVNMIEVLSVYLFNSDDALYSTIFRLVGSDLERTSYYVNELKEYGF